MSQKVLLGMSGGVDSSVAAFLLQQEGYQVDGATMKLFDSQDIVAQEEQTCCSYADVMDAKNVAFALGMQHFVLNFTKDFKEDVIEPFVSAYFQGKTPNPCINCNRFVKFEKFLNKALALGYDHIATGHYARSAYDQHANRFLLKKALDQKKDQSYFLYTMTQEQLSKALFPVGCLHKSEVREIARSEGLKNAQKQESQDICFNATKDYAGFIEHYAGRQCPEGAFVDGFGNELGRHKGIIRYTIGQRKGLGVSFGKPFYVCGIDAETNQILLGEEKDLYQKECYAADVNLIAVSSIPKPLKVKAKIRYNHFEQPAVIEQTGDRRVRVCFDEPQRAVTKGQAVVFYDDDLVVGGGVIE